MPTTGGRPAPAVRAEGASLVPYDQIFDSLGDDPRRVAQANRAAHARKKSVRRRFVDPATCDRYYAAAELEFMQAMQNYKQWSGRMFPTWSEVLEVLRSLGYQKTTGDGALQGAPATAAEIGAGPHLNSGPSPGRVTGPAAH
jgi:uncharacterized protein YfaQ (DUF2300 family)